MTFLVYFLKVSNFFFFIVNSRLIFYFEIDFKLISNWVR